MTTFALLAIGCALVGATPAEAPRNDRAESAAAIALIDAPYSRTYVPESGQSPLTLLAAPADPVGYYEAKVLARRLVEAKKSRPSQ